MFSKSPKPAGSKLRGAPSIIGSTCNIAGNVVGQGELQIDGRIEGNVQCDSLVVGDSGMITGEICADTVLVLGTVTGQIKARTIELASTARIFGDVVYDNLAVATGALVESRFHHAQPSPTLLSTAPSEPPLDRLHLSLDRHRHLSSSED